jgi:putative membrane protein
MKFVISILLNGLLVFIAARFIDGVYIESYGVAVLTGIVLGLINFTIKPLATLLTLPITILTFGLFLIVINGAMVLLADSLLEGFTVNGLGSAIWFSILLTILNFFLGDFGKSKRSD